MSHASGAPAGALRADLISIRSVGHYLHTVIEGEALPSLNERLAPLCRERFRRIDRFIQLALLGSAECVTGGGLARDCALYVFSGVGRASNNIVVQEALLRDHKLPMPFNFVNTLGSSAGYYVARNLGLQGQSLFVSRKRHSFHAGLRCVAADLACGAVTQALIGAVEECTVPLNDHRARQELPDGTVSAEGSHWLLLERQPHREPVVEIPDLEDVSVAFHDSRDAALLTGFVQRAGAQGFALAPAGNRSWTLVRSAR